MTRKRLREIEAEVSGFGNSAFPPPDRIQSPLKELIAFAKQSHAAQRKAADRLKQLENLTTAVRQFGAAMDELMKAPESHERGRRIARLLNRLEHVNDHARYFGLGVDYRKDKPVKPPSAAQLAAFLDAARPGDVLARVEKQEGDGNG